MHHLLITGGSGVGKSTLVANIVNQTSDRLVGFYTREIREDGQRVGFEAQIIGGIRYLLAHTYALGKKLPQVNRYYVNHQIVGDVLCPILLSAVRENRKLLIDEVGLMQMLAGDVFSSAVRTAFDRGTSTIATVPLRADPFVDELKARIDTELWYVTIPNRDALPARLLEFIDTGTIERSEFSSNYRQGY